MVILCMAEKYLFSIIFLVKMPCGAPKGKSSKNQTKKNNEKEMQRIQLIKEYPISYDLSRVCNGFNITHAGCEVNYT